MEETPAIQTKKPEPPPSHDRNPWFAGILSFFLPGLGHIYAGELKRGIIIIILYHLFLLLIFFGYYFFLSIPAMILQTIFTFAVRIIITIYSALTARKQSIPYYLKPYNKWYIYIAIFFISLMSIGRLNVMIMDSFVKIETVPDNSMSNTLLKGEAIAIDNFYYGLHLPFTENYIASFRSPQLNDVVIYYDIEDTSASSQEETMFISRCIVTAGDTLQLRAGHIFINERPLPFYLTKASLGDSNKESMDYHDPDIFPKCEGWNEDYYGPIRVPAKGDTLLIDTSNVSSWRAFILKENDISFDAHYTDLKILRIFAKDGKYIVKRDYIFVLGDNRDNKKDSRYRGFVPVEKVSGRAEMITFSLGGDRTKPTFERTGTRLNEEPD